MDATTSSLRLTSPPNKDFLFFFAPADDPAKDAVKEGTTEVEPIGVGAGGGCVFSWFLYSDNGTISRE